MGNESQRGRAEQGDREMEKVAKELSDQLEESDDRLLVVAKERDALAEKLTAIERIILVAKEVSSDE